jgi:hypothetical protein
MHMQAAILKEVKDVVPQEFHNQVKDMYSWQDVARRTCKVRTSICLMYTVSLLVNTHVPTKFLGSKTCTM